MLPVTIVIPTFNAGPGLDAVLDAIDGQASPLPRHVVALDSGSTDGTVERLRRRKIELVPVPPGRFNHGLTRNEGLARAAGAFAVLLVQDAVPASSGWLDALLEPLQRDPTVAGAFARQRPAPRASLLTRHHLARWVAAQGAARTVGPLTPEALTRMTPGERHAICAFDHVCACVRLSVWRAHPFTATPIAEDLEWGRRVLLSGYRLAFAPAAEVLHSHERSVLYELQRTYLVHQRLHALFDLATIPTAADLLRAVAGTLAANVRIAASEPRRRARAVLRAAGLGIAWPLGQYLGARSSRDGRAWLRTGRI